MGNKHRVLLIFVVLTLAGLACANVDSFMCTTSGGEWIISDDPVEEPYCEKYESGQEQNLDSGANAENGGNTANGEVPQPVESQYAPEYTDAAECAAPESLQIDMEVTYRTDTDSETRCNYSVTFTNIGDELIKVYLYKRNKLLGGEVEEIWKNHVTLKPGISQILRYSTVYNKTQNDQEIEVLIGVAPAAATEGCNNTFQYDTAAREVIGYPINVPCE